MFMMAWEEKFDLIDAKCCQVELIVYASGQPVSLYKPVRWSAPRYVVVHAIQHAHAKPAAAASLRPQRASPVCLLCTWRARCLNALHWFAILTDYMSGGKHRKQSKHDTRFLYFRWLRRTFCRWDSELSHEIAVVSILCTRSLEQQQQERSDYWRSRLQVSFWYM